MKRTSHLILLLYIFIFSCSEDKDPIDNEPELSAIVDSTFGDWEATNGGAVFSKNSLGYSYIRIVVRQQEKETFKHLELFLADEFLISDPPSPFQFEDLSEFVTYGGTYRQSGKGEYRSSQTNFSSLINVTQVIKENEEYYISGDFRFFGCSSSSQPQCVTQQGTFNNFKIYSSLQVLNIHVLLNDQ